MPMILYNMYKVLYLLYTKAVLFFLSPIQNYHNKENYCFLVTGNIVNITVISHFFQTFYIMVYITLMRGVVVFYLLLCSRFQGEGKYSQKLLFI